MGADPLHACAPSQAEAQVILPCKVRVIFAWFDLWIGLYWDRKERNLYVFPVPMFGIVLGFGRRRK